MFNRKLLVTAVIILSVITPAFPQNYSGLQNKKLYRSDDLGSALESLIGKLDGSVTGNIDSVVVLQDYPTELRLRIYYTGYTDCYFSLSALSKARRTEEWVDGDKFSQSQRNSPAECVLKLNKNLDPGLDGESPYLRIDISKKQDGSGKVKIFALDKKWKSNGMATGGLVWAPLQPVGIAARLDPNRPDDVMPAKKIIFDPSVNSYKKGNIDARSNRIKSSGSGNAYRPAIDLGLLRLFDDISGTWINTDPNTKGINRMVITNNNSLQMYSRPTNDEYDWGKTALTMVNATSFKAEYKQSSMLITNLTINLLNGELNVAMVTRNLVNFSGHVVTVSFKMKRNPKAAFFNQKVYTIADLSLLNLGGTPDKTSMGPNSNSIVYLWNTIQVDNNVDFARPQDISSINMTLLADKNPNSGVFYFYPADYHLRWNAEKGYGMRISYGEQTGTGDAGTDAPVRISATLTSGISPREINLVRTLLRTGYPGFTELKYLPLRENPRTTFPGALNAQFDVPTDKVTESSGMDLNAEIQVAWRTDAVTKDYIQEALFSREGITASVVLKPQAADAVDQQIPAVINLADTRVLGKMSLEPKAWRTRNWVNQTMYPLKLKYLHILKKATSSNTPIIYSWSMNNVEVPIRGEVAFDNSRVPAWLDNDPTSVFWMEYSISDCEECDNMVMDTLTGGVSGKTMQQIKFTIAPAVFDSLKASSFIITVRSLQADPKGETLVELKDLPIAKGDTKDALAGPLFLSPGKQLDFEYRVRMASADGDFFISDKWIRATDKAIYLGKTDLKDLFRGIVPWINAP